MNIALLLEMAAEFAPDRIALVCDGKRWTYGDLLAAVRGAFEIIQESGVDYVALLDESSEASMIALFGAALAGVPYCPLNYRLADEDLAALLERIAPALVIGDEERVERLAADQGHTVYSREMFTLKAQESWPEGEDREYDPGEGVAVQLFTSGTTAAPKAAILRHAAAGLYPRHGGVRFGRRGGRRARGRASLSHCGHFGAAVVDLRKSTHRHAACFRTRSLDKAGRGAIRN